MDAELSTSSDLVFALKGGNAFAHLTFKPPSWHSAALYRRKLGPDGANGQWTSISADIDYPAELTITDSLPPGDVIEYGVFRLAADAAAGNQPDIRHTVCCLREPAEHGIEIGRALIERGGTYATLVADTGTRKTFLRAYVKVPPATAPTSGVAVPNNEYQIFDDFTQPHRVTLKPLSSDTDYNCAILVMDNAGNYGWHARSFRTKQRKYSIKFENIKVLDDGDWSARGEMEFRIVVYKVFDEPMLGGAGPAWTTMSGHTVLNDFRFGDDDHPLRLSEGEFRGIPPTYFFPHTEVYGPPANAGDFKIAVNAHGREFDLTSDELASTGNSVELFWPQILMPIAGANEEFTDQEYTLKAEKDTTQGSSFEFSVKLKWSMTYL